MMRIQVVSTAMCLAMTLVAATARAQFMTDTCTSDSVGLPCSYGTCVPGHCSSHDSDGGSFDGPCVLCTYLPGPYCAAANVGQACEDGGVCLELGMGGGGGGSVGSSSSDGGSSVDSYFSETFENTYCGEPPSGSGGSASSDAGWASVGTSSGGSGGPFPVPADAGIADDGGSAPYSGSSSSSGGSGKTGSTSVSSGSGSGGQGTSPPTTDAGDRHTAADDAGAPGSLTGSGTGQVSTSAEAGAGGATDTADARETATGIACSFGVRASPSSRFGFLALVGLGAALLRRRRAS